MTWTATATKITKNDDGETFILEFELTDGVKTIPGPQLKLSEGEAILKRLTDYENQANRRDAQIVAMAALDPAAFIGKTRAELKADYDDANKPPEPTQDEKDLQAFQETMANYTKIEAAYSAAVAAKLALPYTHQDVLDAFATFKATIINNEFFAMIPKGFVWQ